MRFDGFELNHLSELYGWSFVIYREKKDVFFCLFKRQRAQGRKRSNLETHLTLFSSLYTHEKIIVLCS